MKKNKKRSDFETNNRHTTNITYYIIGDIGDIIGDIVSDIHHLHELTQLHCHLFATTEVPDSQHWYSGCFKPITNLLVAIAPSVYKASLK